MDVPTTPPGPRAPVPVTGGPAAGRASGADPSSGAGPSSGATPDRTGTTTNGPTTTAPSAEDAAPVRTGPRAGRELSRAIPVGIGLITLLALSLVFRPEPFVALVALVAVVGTFELAAAAAQRHIDIARGPVAASGVVMVAATWFAGERGLLAAYAGAVALVVTVAVLARRGTNGVRDAAADVFVLTYVPFLVSFAVLLVRMDDGVLLVLTVALLAAANDTGGYVAGILFGKHPVAPTISPKKSWEGVVGSVLACALVSYLLVTVLLGEELWLALGLGLVAVGTATIGDLAESLLKRDLGVKDMSNLLPGHGGLLDRIDSIILTLPLVYLTLGPLARAAG
ncbi:phosphatidate cytidylyltransferase [Georgenia sp. Z1344]|uniref:phosphatidate cytidylyltransferase n=1 Tax=Georgenia sp. Z1344 TaxID=3416706 RepID=UPI003CF10004